MLSHPWTTTCKVLLIDDDANERELTRQALSGELLKFDIIAIATQDQYRSALEQGGFNLVITEYRLAWADGFGIFTDLNHLFPGIPVIMLTKLGNEIVAVQAIKQGMTDYLIKSQRNSLLATVNLALQKSAERQRNQDQDTGLLWCEKWDQVISKLTSDFAYSLRVAPDGQPICEWVTEPFKRFLDIHRAQKNGRGTADGFQFGLSVHPDDQPFADRHIANLFNGLEDIAEYRIVSTTGEVRCFSEHALPIRDWSSGRVVRIYGTIQDITWRRNTENKLRLMQRAIDCSNNGIIISGLADTDYAITYANQAFLNLTGYGVDELIGQNCRILQNDDRDQPEKENLRIALRNYQEGHAILRNYRKDGTPFWSEIYISPVTDDHNRVTHYLGIQNDVTARIQMEMMLHQSEMKMHAIFENVSEAILIFDAQGVVIRANASAEKMFDYGKGEMVGIKLESFLPASQRKIHASFLANHLDSDEPLVIGKRAVAALKQDGSQFLVDIGVNEIKLDKWNLFVATIHDLTESIRADAKLKASEERYRALFENSSEAIFVNRGGDRIEQVNRACLQLWGAQRPEQLLAKKPLELFHSDNHAVISKRIQDGIHNQTVQPTIEEKIIRLDGSVADVLVSAIPFSDQDGPLLFVVLLDMSQRRQAELALRESYSRIQDLSKHLEQIREEERTRIAREIHDDLGAFLTVLKMELSWLENQIPPTLGHCRDKARNMIGEVNEGIQAVKRIVSDLRPSLLDHLGFFPAVEWLVENFRKRTGIHCTLDLPETALELDSSHSTTLYRIIQEALTNILVHAKASEVVITVELINDHMFLTISDNGCGMSLSQLDQTDKYGLLGMRERARYLNAELSIDSRPGKGTVIKLSMLIPSISSEPHND